METLEERIKNLEEEVMYLTQFLTKLSDYLAEKESLTENHTHYYKITNNYYHGESDE